MTATDRIEVDGVMIVFTEEAYEEIREEALQAIKSQPRRSAMMDQNTLDLYEAMERG